MFKDWSGYLKLGVPGALMIMLDMWCYEIITLQSGYLTIEATAAQIILSNIQVFFVQLALGISIASSTLIGSSIGEGNLEKARSYLRVILTSSVCLFLALQSLV
jgi:Na+-driven multidrug efflux pump